MTNEIKSQVEALLREDDRLKAIEYLKGSYNISEQDATILVEALEREVGLAREDFSGPEIRTATTLGGTLKVEVAGLLKSGRKLEAVQHVRSHLQVGMREALSMVEEVAREVTPGYVSYNPAGCLKTVVKGIGYFVMVVALMSLATALIIFVVQKNSISTSDRVNGVVNELRFLDSGESAPVVTFEWKGKKRLYESTNYTNPDEYAVGQEVPLFVNREDPDNIILDTFSGRWSLIVGFGVIGSGLMLIAIVFLYFGRRKF